MAHLQSQICVGTSVVRCPSVRAGTHWWRRRKSTKPKANKVADFRLCCRIFANLPSICRRQRCRQIWTRSTWSTLSKVGDFCRLNVERPFDFVSSVYGANSKSHSRLSRLSTKSTASSSTLSPAVCTTVFGQHFVVAIFLFSWLCSKSYIWQHLTSLQNKREIIGENYRSTTYNVTSSNRNACRNAAAKSERLHNLTASILIFFK